MHIQPGKSTPNAHVESFHGKLREEYLRVSWFQNLFDARKRPRLGATITTSNGHTAF
jgi:transposase InsO family protein